MLSCSLVEISVGANYWSLSMSWNYGSRFRPLPRLFWRVPDLCPYQRCLFLDCSNAQYSFAVGLQFQMVYHQAWLWLTHPGLHSVDCEPIFCVTYSSLVDCHSSCVYVISHSWWWSCVSWGMILLSLQTLSHAPVVTVYPSSQPLYPLGWHQSHTEMEWFALSTTSEIRQLVMAPVCHIDAHTGSTHCTELTSMAGHSQVSANWDQMAHQSGQILPLSRFWSPFRPYLCCRVIVSQCQILSWVGNFLVRHDTFGTHLSCLCCLSYHETHSLLAIDH